MAEAADSLAKARRLAEQAARIGAADYEMVIEASYYAMFHAARAVILATEGDASTNHGRVLKAFARVVQRLGLDRQRPTVETLQTAYDMRIEAIYRDGTRSLREDAQRLRHEMQRFVALCEEIVRSTPPSANGAPERPEDHPRSNKPSR